METRIALLLEGAPTELRSRWDSLGEEPARAGGATPGGRSRSKSPASARTASRVPVAADAASAAAPAAGRVRAAAGAALLEGELRDVIVNLQTEVSNSGVARLMMSSLLL